jgi:hypothetical protein
LHRISRIGEPLYAADITHRLRRPFAGTVPVRITLAGIIIAFLLISLALELIRRSINDSLKNGTGEPFIWLDVLGLKIMTRKQFRRPLE